MIADDLIHWVKTFFRDVALAIAAALVLGVSVAGATEGQRDYILATAAVGGTYFPVGSALATLITTKLRPTHQVTMTTITSGGAEENAQLLQQDRAHFALTTALIGHYAWTGQGPFAAAGPQGNFRSVASLWQNVEHFIVKRKYAETGTIEDMRHLRGRPVSLGLKGSGTLRASRFLLGNLGIDADNDLDLIYYSTFDQAAEALPKGQIEAMSMEAGVPVAAVTLAMTAWGHDLVILEFTDTQLEKADGGLGLWNHYVIPAGTYPAQDEDINTIALSTFLAVSAEVDEDVVYQITKTIYENLGFLRIVHRALADTSLDNALTGLPMPLHPGALRYYREVGLEVPAELIVE